MSDQLNSDQPGSQDFPWAGLLQYTANHNSREKQMRHVFLLHVLGMVFLLLSGCASYPVNPPLQQHDEPNSYRLGNLSPGEKNTDELFVILSMSGGGTRVMALNYGVVGYLDQIRFGTDNRSLLDEVDIISSSSASSIPAAYYGLFGKEKFLAHFDDDILYQKLETSLRKRLFNPLQWPRTASANFSRGDMLAEYFDKHVFGGGTFADMQRQRPFIMLNATDMGIVSQFAFTQTYFDWICSDLSQVSVSRAVTASLAFTPYFTPITLKNHNDGQCGYKRPAWVQNALQKGAEADPLVHRAARDVISYENIEKRPYIHLLDSGISDNMGIRSPLLAYKVTDHFDKVMKGSIKKLIIIMIDAKSNIDFPGDLKAKPPGVFKSVHTIATQPLDNYSYETVNLIKQTVRDQRDGLNKNHTTKTNCDDHAKSICNKANADPHCFETVSESCRESFGLAADSQPIEPDIHLLHVSFELLEDQTMRQHFQSIPTKLELPRETVDSLIDIAPSLLQQDPEFHALLKELGARVVE